jgi:hypothetical protein
MNLNGRLARLERRLPPAGSPTFGEQLALYEHLSAWLDRHGHADALAALEAGAAPPAELKELLHDRAAADRRDRAWARIEAALAAGEVPAAADIHLHSRGADLQCA